MSTWQTYSDETEVRPFARFDVVLHGGHKMMAKAFSEIDWASVQYWRYAEVGTGPWEREVEAQLALSHCGALFLRVTESTPFGMSRWHVEEVASPLDATRHLGLREKRELEKAGYCPLRLVKVRIKTLAELVTEPLDLNLKPE
jgi:hypothetical protein